VLKTALRNLVRGEQPDLLSKPHCSRITHCSRTRILAQIPLVAGSLGSGVLAFIDLSMWAAAISTSGITAYLEFLILPKPL
jgi:hypothetical protein